jgi:hypothetical protein
LPEKDPETGEDTERPDWIILSGHSQGTVISASVIFQLPVEFRDRVWFFSYGCQLTEVYGRVFPAYFAPERLRELSELLTSDPAKCLRWTNFWRATDPIGWEVAGGQDNVPIEDPVALQPCGGEVVDPVIRNHSDYPAAAEFDAKRTEVCGTLLPPAQQSGAGGTTRGGPERVAARARTARSPQPDHRSRTPRPVRRATRRSPARPCRRMHRSCVPHSSHGRASTFVQRGEILHRVAANLGRAPALRAVDAEPRGVDLPAPVNDPRLSPAREIAGPQLVRMRRHGGAEGLGVEPDPASTDAVLGDPVVDRLVRLTAPARPSVG